MPKKGCATHIFKARLAKVFIGIRDPDIDIENEGANDLIAKGIQVEDFHPDVADKIRSSLAEFIKYKEDQKLIIKHDRKNKLIDYLKQSVVNTSISQFSTEAVSEFIENSRISFNYPSQDFNEWALSFGLANKVDEKIEPTKLGLILFGEKVDEILTQIIFKVELDYGNGRQEIKDFGGPVSTQLPRVLNYIEDKAIKLIIDRSRAQRETHADFPKEILREVIANAIIHRDYSITEATNYIYISSEKIIVRSPGKPVQPFTIDDIRTMDLPSVSRNPKIMFVYNRMGLAEQRGIGLRNMKQLPTLGFPLPVFNLKGNILEIVFARDASLIPELKGVSVEGLSKEDREGLFFIQQQEAVSVKDYAIRFKLTDKTAQRRIAVLFEKGLLEKVGENRWVKYQIKK